MKCENCGTNLSEDAKICHECGNQIEKNNIDNMLEEMVANKNKKKIKNRQPKNKNKLKLENVSKVVGYLGAAIVLLLFLSLFLNWFEMSGKALTKGIISEENIVENIKTSPIELMKFIGKYEKEYIFVTTKEELENKQASIPSMINILYVRGFYIIFAMIFISASIFLFDKKLKFVFLNRIMNILTAIIIALNYMAVKVPFFNMIVLRARTILQYENIKYPVFININGISVNEQFYPYKLVEQTGFFVAVIAIILWFVMTTILVEIRKEREKTKKIAEN